jgi:hypothetical protein
MAGVPPLPPGGYTGPPYAPPPGHGHGAYALHARFEPFGGLATAATALLGIMAVLALFGLGAHLNRVGLIEREFRDGGVTLEELEDADDGVGAAALVYGLGLPGTAAVFITWQHRHAVNADSLAGSEAALGPAWAIGGWFVPCANWLLPGMQLFGASRASDPALPLQPAAGPAGEARSSSCGRSCSAWATRWGWPAGSRFPTRTRSPCWPTSRTSSRMPRSPTGWWRPAS